MFGFSLGGFLAAEFASDYPEKITKLILLGARKCYSRQSLENIKRQILPHPRTWLYQFYNNCFSKADASGRKWFKKNLLKEYLDKLNLAELIRGLDYLAGRGLNLGALKRIKGVSIFHGSDDLIAPVEEILEIIADLPQTKLTFLADRGHLFFLNSDFRERFYGE